MSASNVNEQQQQQRLAVVFVCTLTFCLTLLLTLSEQLTQRPDLTWPGSFVQRYRDIHGDRLPLRAAPDCETAERNVHTIWRRHWEQWGV